MGFESAHMARRRLASLAMNDSRVREALTEGNAMPVNSPETDGRSGSDHHALATELELLAREIASTPGAGGALLATFADQARILHMIVQAAERAPGKAIPTELLNAARNVKSDSLRMMQTSDPSF